MTNTVERDLDYSEQEITVQRDEDEVRFVSYALIPEIISVEGANGRMIVTFQYRTEESVKLYVPDEKKVFGGLFHRSLEGIRVYIGRKTGRLAYIEVIGFNKDNIKEKYHALERQVEVLQRQARAEITAKHYELAASALCNHKADIMKVARDALK